MPRPCSADDPRWQTLVHGSPVHVSLCCGIPRTELPLLLALVRSWSEGLVLSDADHLHLVLHDPDAAIALETVVTAVGPAVGVVVLDPHAPHTRPCQSTGPGAGRSASA
jgi:hypothetical protein